MEPLGATSAVWLAITYKQSALMKGLVVIVW